MDNAYNELKKMVLDAIHKNGACKDGYRDVLSADNIGIFSQVLKDYWADVITMHKHSSFSLFEEFYRANREGFNRHGIYYNESANNGYVLVTDSTQKIMVSGEARAWVFGDSTVYGSGNASIRLRERSMAVLEDAASCFAFDESKVYANGRNRVNASGMVQVFANGLCIVDAGECSTVYGVMWDRINALGDAVVKAHSDRKINLFGNARLELTSVEEMNYE